MAKGKGTAVTTSALIQWGSGMVAYVTKMPHLEYSDEESNMLGDGLADVFGTLSSKKAKAINAFLSQWGPWISFAGIVGVTTIPKVQLTRAMLAERQRERQEKASAVHTRESINGHAAAAVSAPSVGHGLGVEGRDDTGEGSEVGHSADSSGLGFGH